jgi:uncharacterized protein involved in type VI secretion and phage assembly
MSVVPIRSDSQHEAGGMVAGVATARVSQIKDPDGLGRVKLKLPWRDENFETDWCRIAAPMAGKDRGVFFMPEVGDEVLVAFDRDDIRHPYVLGQLWSRPDQPPKNDAGGKNDLRVIVSRKGHKVTFDDGSKGRVRIELNDGKSIQIDDDGVTISDNANTITMNGKGGSVTLEARQTLTLKAPTITVQATGSLDLDGGGMLKAHAGMVMINS